MDLDEKLQNIENQLKLILSKPLSPGTKWSEHHTVEELNRNLDHINNLVTAKMASSEQPNHTIAHAGKRVLSLQKAVHAWTQGRPLPPSVNSGESSPGSLIESCVTDDDGGFYYNGEVSGMAGFKVYENPEFIGDSDDDKHDSIIDEDRVEEIDGNCEEGIIGVTYQEEEQELEPGTDRVEETDVDDEEGIIRVADSDGEKEPELEPGNDGVEREVIRVDYQKEENSEEDEEEEEEEQPEEEGTKNCCYKIIFWGLMVAIGAISFKVGFSDFPDQYASEMFLTPT